MIFLTYITIIIKFKTEDTAQTIAVKRSREVKINMSRNRNSNNLVVPEARSAMEKFKMEAANEVGVELKDGYNGDITSREAGSVGGQMVKKMIKMAEQNMADSQS